MAGISNPFDVTVASAGLTTATTNYTSGDQLGTEITVATGGGASARAVITAVTVVDVLFRIGPIEAWIFNTTTTEAADNAAASWSDGDIANLEGIISIGSPITQANNAAISVGNLWVGPFITDASGNFYASLVTRSANGFFATDAASIKLKFQGFYFS